MTDGSGDKDENTKIKCIFLGSLARESKAKAPPAKRWEKGYGDENELNA